MAKVLGVKWMSLRLLADGMNGPVVDLLVGGGKFFPNEWGPIAFRNRTQGIMAASPVERPSAIHKHLLDQMLAAAEKDVSDVFVILDDAAKFFFHAIVTVFQDLLKLV